MKKILLLTGSDGFVGSTLRDIVCKDSLYKNYFDIISLPSSIDIRDEKSLATFINGVNFDYVIHLASQTFVPYSYLNPKETYEVNFFGTCNLLEALKNNNFTGRVLYVSTSEVYGNVNSDSLPIRENHSTNPTSPYAVSKLSAEFLCKQMVISGNLDIIIVRPFNHFGAGQDRRFSISNFSFQLVSILRGKLPKELHVGNIDITRDFLDVRDVIRAYLLLLDAPISQPKVYNVCSGIETSVGHIIKSLTEILELEVDIIVDADRVRVTDQNRIVGSCNLLKEKTGWSAVYSLEDTLISMINYWKKIYG